MAKWAKSYEDIKHIVEISENLFAVLKEGFLINIVLNDRREIEGWLTASSFGNNAVVVRPPTRYYGEITLKQLDGSSTTLDLLDIQFIRSATSPAKLKQYKEAGVIEIVNFPEGV